MDKTRVDDMLIEMISPKIKEIEEKFSSGKGLNQEDINTLLLKSQYNHINHLDLKLNEVTESVVKLEHRLENLEQKFINLEQKLTGDYKNLEQKVTSELKTFEQKMEATINDALNKNMTKLIMIMGAFIALFKIIDKF